MTEKKGKPISVFGWWSKWSSFGKFTFILLVIILSAVVYLIMLDPGNISSEPYGAGDYYYTDVDGYEKVFFHKSLGTNHPIIFFTLFIGWGAICWYFLRWIERKS